MDIGERHSRLVALEKISSERWLFQCDCGAEKFMNPRNVASGKSKSCGCLQREMTSEAKRTHGHSTGGKISPEFSSYRNMLARCYRPSNNRFSEYGARGIKVCERWRASFQHFLDDMGTRPRGWSIERKDNDGDYEPSNCQWAPTSVQARNRSSNILVEMEGCRVTLIEASERSGIPYGTLKTRLLRHGWSDERATTTPVRPQRRRRLPTPMR